MKAILIKPKQEGLGKVLEEFIAVARDEWERQTPDFIKNRMSFEIAFGETENEYKMIIMLPWGELPLVSSTLKKKLCENLKKYLKARGYNAEISLVDV